MPKINAIYAFISTGEDPEDEGVVAMKIGNDWVPMMGADEARMESLKPVAEEIARVTGQRIILVKFTNREELEQLEGSNI